MQQPDDRHLAHRALVGPGDVGKCLPGPGEPALRYRGPWDERERSRSHTSNMEWARKAFKDNPFGRIGDPYDDVSPIFVFLASDDSHWMTGQNLHADGGVWISA